MKQARILLIAFAAMLIVGAVSCGKDDNGGSDIQDSMPINPDPDPDPSTAEWIDLGLPSGLLWYSCNLGANKPEEYGNYYAWGETNPKEVYGWNTYAFGTDYNQLTKYCNISAYGLNGFIDGLTVLQVTDDAATIALGASTHTPTVDEWDELMNNTTMAWTIMNGVNGLKFTASNGNSIFLPAAGRRSGSELLYPGDYGTYWSSSLDLERSDCASCFRFDSDIQYVGKHQRCAGFTIRAVRQS